MNTSRLLGRTSASSGAVEEITVGSGLSLSGGSLTSTVTATPGGSNTQVQFNDSSSFGGDAGLTYDKTNDKLAVGAITSPQASTHVYPNVGETVDPPTSFSASLVSETLPSAPTGSITKIAEPSAGTGGGGISFTNAGTGTALTANGTAYYARVYPCLYVAATGTYYKSVNYEQFGPTSDPNDSQTYDFQVNGGSVTISGETTYYFVEYSTDGSSYSPLGVVASNTTDWTSLSGSDTTTAWPSYYVNTPGTPAGAPSGLSQSVTNEGMGTFNGGAGSNGTTWYYEIDAYVTIGGIKYVSGSPTTSNLMDNNNSQSYDWSLSYTPGSPADGHILRRSNDNSTWEYTYLDASGSYTDTGFSNDTDAASRWGQTYSAGSVQYDFTGYGSGTTASGNTVYSVAGTSYNTTVSADSVKYIFKHTLSGGSGTLKILENESNAYGVQPGGSTYYDVGYTTWGAGTTVTPNSYGYSGTNQNRDYRIYSYKVVGGVTIYSSTYATASVTSGSGSKYVSLSWTNASGATGVKIFRQVNGGGFSATCKQLTGTSTVDDAVDTSWGTSGTITPTTIQGVTGRFDHDTITRTTDTPALAVIDTTGSGTRYSQIGFGTAADRNSTASFQSYIANESSTGYLYLTTGRINLEASRGATPSVILGNANVFNNGSSSTIHLQVKGQNDASLINTRSDMDTVGFGQAIGTDEQATVQIQPARSFDTGLVLKGHASQSSTSEIMRVQTSGGSYNANVTVGGNFQAVQGSASVPGHNFRADADTGIYGLTTNTLGFATGGSERGRIDSSGRWGFGQTSPLSTVDTTSFASGIVSKTGAYTATATDHTILCNATSAAFTITLPASSGATRRRYVIKKTDSSANAVTIDGNASETIDGATTYALNNQYESVEIQCDGSNWHII